MSSVAIATYLTSTALQSKERSKILRTATIGFVLFLVCTYPVVAFSKEAYNTFTAPAEEGLEYISHMDLTNKTISMGYDQQLAAYVDLSQNFTLVGFPPSNLTISKPDIIVMRINYFYFLSMRYDLSFTNNSYTRLHDYLVSDTSPYKLVFSNSEFQVYAKASSQVITTIDTIK